MSRGVIYQLTGLPYAELLVASLYTLRRHYDGPVTICFAQHCRKVVGEIIAEPRLHCDAKEVWLSQDGQVQYPHFIAKTSTYLASPYDQTVYLDCDVMVQSDISPLFEYRLGLTRINDSMRLLDKTNYAESLWRETRYFRKYSNALCDLVDECRAANPLVCNMGVFAFEKSLPFLQQMHLLTMIGRTWRCSDESAAHLLLPSVSDVAILDEQWNALIRECRQWQRARIIHLNYGGFYRTTAGRQCFDHYYGQVLKSNLANVRQWGGTYNDHIAKANNGGDVERDSQRRALSADR